MYAVTGGQGLEGPPATAAESSESTAQRHQAREHPPCSDSVAAQGLESTLSDQTASVTPRPSHQTSCGTGLTQAVDVDAPSVRPQGVPVTRCSSVSPTSPAQPVDPRFTSKLDYVRQHPEKSKVASTSGSSPGLEGSNFILLTRRGKLMANIR
ncbi:hypothetical protein MRX96_035658 [Rhipicephalus microplus]